MRRITRAALAASSASAFLLTFAWPFAVSADPAHPLFQMLAVATFVTLLASIAALAFITLRGSS